MKKKLFLFTICLIFSVFRASSQENIEGQPKIAKNMIYADLAILGLMGNGHINYERVLIVADKGYITARIGAGVYFDWEDNGIMYPATFNYIIGKKKHHLDFSGGIVYCIDNYSKSTQIAPIFGGAYRIQKPEGGFVFRVKGEFAGYVEYPILLGISLGYAF